MFAVCPTLKCEDVINAELLIMLLVDDVEGQAILAMVSQFML